MPGGRAWRAALLFVAGICRGAGVCEPDAAIQGEFDAAESAPVRDPADFDRNVAPFRALRAAHELAGHEPAAHEDDLFVHERYQDAVRRHGIEGHLKAMAEEYQLLALRHPGDLKYRYLAARALIGRGTRSAVESLSVIAAENPDFAPSHRALAEIYGSEAFRDLAQQASQREKLLALCPQARLAQLDPPLPDPSPLLGAAERLFRENAHAEEIAEMAAAAIRADEWRLQRIRAFDWYSTELKRQSLREMQSEYWRLWDLEVRYWRKNGQLEKAEELLAAMRHRAATLADPERLAQVERLRAEGFLAP
jgi:hypothetical protein